MSRSDTPDWMWSQALHMLAQADRMQRQMFRPQTSQVRQASWEPPVDVLETETAVLVFAALPGVDPSHAKAVIEDGVLVISGEQALPEELRTAVVHRLELPHGCFERRVPLPPGRYDSVQRIGLNGCLVITLSKARSGRPNP